MDESRLKKIERAVRNIKPTCAGRTFVYHVLDGVGPLYGMCDGEPMTLAEWQSIRQSIDQMIIVHDNGLESDADGGNGIRIIEHLDDRPSLNDRRIR